MPVPVVDLPLGATEDRVVGTLDLERALTDQADSVRSAALHQLLMNQPERAVELARAHLDDPGIEARSQCADVLADVDLVTIPRREGTQLTIYNSADLTLVREQRSLTLQQGLNRLQFSWANTLIDPTSIDFRILAKQDQVDLVDTTYPSGRNDALQWNIRSEIAGKIPVEIRYFTSGITWTADYVGIANQDETNLRLTGYVRVFNNSGELYDNAQTRLVVGTINLVEKIADLATRPAPGGPAPPALPAPNGADPFGGRANEALLGAIAKAESKPDAPKQVIKQGLSEYFLFTIEGREDIKDKEPKRLVSMKVADVPLECIYKLTDRKKGAHFTKYYRFKN